MRAMVLDAPGRPLRAADLPVPVPGPDDVLLQVQACAVCRTDLHVVDGELPDPKLPLIPGHEIVGTVVRAGQRAAVAPGSVVGVPWLGSTCGVCRYCTSERENLCVQARFTGYTLDGGYAGHALADARFCLPIPAGYSAVEAAPFLCAGLIGYRSLTMTGTAPRLGLYGFGAAAHIVAQVARHQGRQVYAFVRPGDDDARRFALDLGAVWAGGSEERPPVELDAAIIFAPVGALVPLALAAVAPGGVVVCGGIHMSDVPAFPYRLLWQERVLRSVANLTRQDGRAFFALLEQLPLRTDVRPYPLDAANAALDDLRRGAIHGAAVLVP